MLIRNMRKKTITIVVSVLLMICIVTGGTIAFLMDDTDTIDNKFTPSSVTTEVTESFKGTVKSNVQIKNTGDTEAWIRAAVVVTWQDEAGNVYGQALSEDDDYEMTWYDEDNTIEDNWIQGQDGFYYYKNPVNADGYTTVLFTDCKLKEGVEAPETGYYLNVEIIGSGIQSVPARVFNTEWASSGLQVNEDGTALERAN